MKRYNRKKLRRHDRNEKFPPKKRKRKRRRFLVPADSGGSDEQ